VTITGHSFTNVCAASMSMYGMVSGKVAPRLDLAWAVIPKYFYEFGTNLCGKSKDVGMTQAAMNTVFQKFGVSLPVKKQEELFDDKWEELFQIEFDGDCKSTGQKLKECYDRLKKG
jgi:hypothetical protein